MPSNNSSFKAHPQPPDERHQKVFISRHVDKSRRRVFQVKISLGEALRRVKMPKVILNLREGVVSIRGNLSAHTTHETKTHHQNTTDTHPMNMTRGRSHPGSIQHSNHHRQAHSSEDAHDQQEHIEIPTQADKSSSDSEIEILEVRPVRKRRYYNPGSDPNIHDPLANEQDISQSYYTESDLSSLDDELNQVLSSTTEAKPSQPPRAYSAPVVALPKLFIPADRSRSPPPPGYRNIPPNLMNAIHREMNVVFDGSADDEIEVVGKRIFSLKDPIARTKIKLPIKATTCRHFECFDFFNFCLFYKLPPGTQGGLKRSLVLQSKEARDTEQLFLRQQQLIQNGKLSSKAPGLVYPQFSENGQMFFTDLFSRTPPLYKCPLCDEKFGLKQLYISDIFNFFVKTTPVHTTKIMLVENNRYKIVEEEKHEKANQEPEIVELSGDEDEEPNVKIEKAPTAATEQRTSEEEENEEESERTMTESNKGEDELNDGLDDFLSTITRGDGSWENPMTLD